MSNEPVIYEKTGAVACITLNRPERRNALGKELGNAMRAAFGRVDEDRELRAVILTGSGNSFCAGADLKDPESHTTSSVAAYLERHIWDYFPRPNIPVIAAINGYAFGAGMELAMCCDIVIASEQAEMGLLHIRWGLYPAGGGAARMASAAGKAQAMYYVLTGERFDARTALNMGLVSKVVPPDELMDTARNTAQAIAQWSPTVVRLARDCIWEAVERPLQQLAETDRYRNLSLYSSHDREEGHRAFVEKREPSSLSERTKMEVEVVMSPYFWP